MALRKLRNGKWRAQPHLGKLQLPTKVCATKDEALEWERLQKMLARGGYDLRAAQRPVHEAMNEWLARIEQSGNEREFKNSRWVVGMTPDWFLTLKLGAVTTAHIDKVLSGMRKHDGQRYARASLQRIQSTMSGFFTHMVNARVLSANPVQGSRVPSAPAPREGKALSPAELEAVYAVWLTLNIPTARIAYLMGQMGLRWGEVRALRVRHIGIRPATPDTPEHAVLFIEHSWSEGYPIKDTKNSRRRYVVIPDAVWPILDEAATGKGPEDFLFPRLHSKRFRSRLKWSETMPDFTMHDLRHTAITYWFIAGVETITIKHWAGHSSLTVTDRYSHHVGTHRDAVGLQKLNLVHANIMHRLP